MWKIHAPSIFFSSFFQFAAAQSFLSVAQKKQKRHPSKGVFSPGGQIKRGPGFWSQNVEYP